jgi:hypothetical protein
MSRLAAGIKWIMLVSGVLTCTMFYAALDPSGAFKATFGEELEGDAARIVVRNWGALIGLVGLLLIYGALRPAFRALALTVGGASKAVFVGLVLAHGSRFLSFQAGIAVAIDSLAVLLFVTCLIHARMAAPAGVR